MATRTLNLYGNNLKKDATLMLTFSPLDPSRLYINQLSVVWKVVTLHSGGRSKATIQFVDVARHALGDPQLDQDNTITSEVGKMVQVQPGQAITLAATREQRGEVTTVVGSEGSKEIFPAAKGPSPNLASLKNKIGDQTDVSLGFVHGDGIDQRYEPALFWKGLGPATTPEVKLTPTLFVYVTHDSKATEFIRSEIESKLIWTQDLNSLPEVSSWNFLENENSGFSLEPASTP